MVNLTMDEAWHVKNYFVINTKLKQDGLVLSGMIYLDLIVSVSIELFLLFVIIIHNSSLVIPLFAGNVVNKPEHGSLDWVKICEKSSKVITFIDLAGHERYLKTTVFGMTGHAPDFGKIILL